MKPRHRRSLIALLLGAVITLLGFGSCSSPEELTQDKRFARNDSVPDAHVMYGVAPTPYRSTPIRK